MKTKHLAPFATVLFGLFAAADSSFGQGTAFTYQGRLNDGAGPANGSYDLQFTVYGSATGTNDGFANQTNSVTVVSNGLFVVTLDFGPGIFTGPDRWLEIATRTNGGGGFVTLSPRQKITPTPYAIMAGSAGTLANGGLTGFGVQAMPNIFDLSSLVNIVGGSPVNSASGYGDTISGGGAMASGIANPNQILGNFGTVGGGLGNTVSSDYGTVGGGTDNSVDGDSTVGGGAGNTGTGGFATVGGGDRNTSSGNTSTIGGGYNNNSSGTGATVGGGDLNTSSGLYATVGGGLNNNSIGTAATVPGGDQNYAVGDFSFAAGRRANANHRGSFVWADSQDADFDSTANDTFNIRAAGGVQIATNTSLNFGTQVRQMLNLWGTQYAIGVQSYTLFFRTDNSFPGGGFAWYEGGTNSDQKTNSGGGTTMMTLDSTGLRVNGTFVSASDRNLKQDFAAVDGGTVLAKVAQLPIQTWAYKNDPGTKHLGPVAQDFYAAFNVGPDDRHIATVDESGVALAAIQGLNEKLEEQRMENAELKRRLEALERMVRGEEVAPKNSESRIQKPDKRGF